MFSLNSFFSSFFAQSPPSYAGGWKSRPQSSRLYRYLRLRPDNQLPFYCQPIILFAISWLAMLGSLAFHVSYDSYPGMELPILLFSISIISLMAGYMLVHFFSEKQYPKDVGAEYMLDVSKLRRLNQILVLIAILIMVVNVKLEGLPPVFGLFSFDTKVYLEYGRLKQLLFPVLIIITVNAFLDPSRLRKVLYSSFGLLSMLVYVTRGGILGALMQAFFVFSMTTKISKKRLLARAAGVLVVLIVLADVIGSNRTTQAGFLEFLQIRKEFWEWPMVSLWVISYFSIPLSNLCWIVHDFHFTTATFSFLNPALPSFWLPSDPHESFIAGQTHVIDNVHTYLAPYFMDFSFAGIFLANLVLGAICAILVRRGIGRYFLTSAIFLGCVADIFFNDNFIPLSTLLQFVAQAFVQHYLLKAVAKRSEHGSVAAIA